MKPTQRQLLLAGTLLALGLGAYVWWRSPTAGPAPAQARKLLYYQDSMHPWIKSDQPGKCTVCAMDLTPIYEGEQGPNATSNMVVLSPNSVTVLNVQTEETRRQPLTLTLRVAGTLDANETRTTVFAAPAAGRIESLAVEYAGVEVEEGQALLTFYSPELVAQRRQYVVRGRSIVSLSQTAPLRMHENEEASRQPRPGPGAMAGPRPASPRPTIESDPYYCDLLAPQSGTVIDRSVFAGQYVTEGDRIFTIVDTSVLWFRFDVYERQLAWLQPGQTIRVTVPAVPGKEFPTVISWIEPTIDVGTRTVKVRADLANPKIGPAGREQRLLRLGMYAEGQVTAEIPDVLAVPRSAILSPGGRTYAYVERSHGAYAMRQLTLGRQGDTHCEVLDGLEEGDRVVTSGNVLIDAQAQFTQTTPSEPALTEGPLAAPAMTDHAPTPLLGPNVLPPTDATPAARAPSASSALPSPSHQTQQPGSTARAASPVPVRVNNNRNPQAMDRMTQVVAARLAGRSATEPTSPQARPTNSPVSDRLTEAQRAAIEAFVPVAAGVSQALAADDLNQFNQQVARMSTVLPPLQKELVAPHRWEGLMKRLAGLNQGQPAKDLAEARSRFLPFSTAMVEWAKQLRKEDPAFAALKIYHCPMAPKPGVWIQSNPPLANPYYGAKMLTCGEEVQP